VESELLEKAIVHTRGVQMKSNGLLFESFLWDHSNQVVDIIGKAAFNKSMQVDTVHVPNKFLNIIKSEYETSNDLRLKEITELKVEQPDNSRDAHRLMLQRLAVITCIAFTILYFV
jgi:hypothetical protein